MDLAPGTYEVHEWGLMRAGARDVLEVGTLGPPLQIEPMVVEKPVLYFHVNGTVDLSLASVEALEGTIREHWPLSQPPVGPVDPSRISWAPLTLRPRDASCAFSGPTDRAAACNALPLDEVCESLSLSSTVTPDAACVETASGPSPLLFYRSTSRGLTVPLTAHYLDFGDINVRNDSDQPIPGMLVRFIQGSSGLRIVVASPPAPHEVILVGHEDGGVEAARAALTRSMLELGLTDSEAQAFLSSWSSQLFPPTEDEIVTEESEESVPDTTTLLYFLPPALAEQVSRLTFSPEPVATRRALAVWTAVE